MDDITKIKKIVQKQMKNNDPAHDFEHVMRVYSNAEKLCDKEGVEKKLVLASVLLHDIVSFPKSDKRSKNSSTKSAIKAKQILKKLKFSKNEIKIISNAIKTHSFSKNEKPTTLVGKILQDADRLDALGAIGITRVFTVGGVESRTLYSDDDPFCNTRKPDDKKWTLDHFYSKLLVLESTMNTKSAKLEASRRTLILKNFLKELKNEINHNL